MQSADYADEGDVELICEQSSILQEVRSNI